MKWVPDSEDDFDTGVSNYLEYLWSAGDPYTFGAYSVAGIQWLMPRLVGRLKLSWKLLRAWAKQEPPKRATPMNPLVVMGLAGLAVEVGAPEIACLLLVGFDLFLRSGEIFLIKSGDVAFKRGHAVIRLCSTKTSKRSGFNEIAVLKDKYAVKLLRYVCERTKPDQTLAGMNGYRTRKILDLFLETDGLQGYGFAWYSLRRGGAHTIS